MDSLIKDNPNSINRLLAAVVISSANVTMALPSLSPKLHNQTVVMYSMCDGVSVNLSLASIRIIAFDTVLCFNHVHMHKFCTSHCHQSVNCMEQNIYLSLHFIQERMVILCQASQWGTLFPPTKRWSRDAVPVGAYQRTQGPFSSVGLKPELNPSFLLVKATVQMQLSW